MPRCPHCDQPIDVRFIKAPAMQSDSAPSGDTADLEALLNQIDDTLLTESGEVDFVSQTRERFAKYGDRTKMSDKQMNWLKRIAAK